MHGTNSFKVTHTYWNVKLVMGLIHIPSAPVGCDSCYCCYPPFKKCLTDEHKCTMCLTIIIYISTVPVLDLQNWTNGKLCINTLEPELSAHCTLQKNKDLYGHPLLCVFLADNFSGCSFISLLHWTSTPSTRRLKHCKDMTFVIMSVYRIYI